MAAPTNKSNRKFDFEKPQKRTFDFTKDEDEVSMASKSWRQRIQKWVWIFLALVVFVVIVSLIVSRCKKPNEKPQMAETIEEVNPEEEGSSFIDSLGKSVPENNIEEKITDSTEEGTQIESTSLPQEPQSLPTETVISKPVSGNNVSNDVETEAMKVIRGDYGVGQERKDKLGTKYQPIQSRVNQLKREGVF